MIDEKQYKELVSELEYEYRKVLQTVLTEQRMPFFCSRCKQVHKYGSQNWKYHLIEKFHATEQRQPEYIRIKILEKMKEMYIQHETQMRNTSASAKEFIDALQGNKGLFMLLDPVETANRGGSMYFDYVWNSSFQLSDGSRISNNVSHGVDGILTHIKENRDMKDQPWIIYKVEFIEVFTKPPKEQRLNV